MSEKFKPLDNEEIPAIVGISPERRDRFTAQEDDFEIIKPAPKRKKKTGPKMETVCGGIKKPVPEACPEKPTGEKTES